MTAPDGRLERALFQLDNFLASWFGGTGERDDTKRFIHAFQEAGFCVQLIEDGRPVPGEELLGGDPKMAENISPDQQIERLVRQRNALWGLLERFALDHGDDADGEGDGLRPEDDDPFRIETEESLEEIVVRIRNPLATVSALRLAAGKLWDQCREITRENYSVEGISPATGERYDDERDIGPYGRVAAEEEEPWRP